ncbi:MAG: XdhC family protein, partial [Ignavibacteriaceae bacterium]|nr:XdhC family protein [Ignavibacteriaceae bacterium]
MNEATLWNFVLQTISSDKKAVLLVVAESSNSSPGRQGFKMVITQDAEQSGTIGGGIMEKDMVDYSLDLLFGNEFRLIKKLHHTDKT